MDSPAPRERLGPKPPIQVRFPVGTQGMIIEKLAHKSQSLETKLFSYRRILYSLFATALLGILSGCSSPNSSQAIEAISSTQTAQLAENTYSESLDIVPRHVRDSTYRIVTNNRKNNNPLTERNFVGTTIALQDNSNMIVTMLVNRHTIEEPNLPITSLTIDNKFGFKVSGPAYCEPYPGLPAADLALCSIEINSQSMIPTLGLNRLIPGALPIAGTAYIQYGLPYDSANPDRLMPVANFTTTDAINPMLNPSPEVDGEYDPNNWYWSFPNTLSGGGGSGGPIVDMGENVVAIQTAGSVNEPYYSLATPLPADLLTWYNDYLLRSISYFNNN